MFNRYGVRSSVHACNTRLAYMKHAADRPARQTGSAHAKYSVSHHMVIKPFLLLGLNTDLDGRCDKQLSDDHQQFMTITGELS